MKYSNPAPVDDTPAMRRLMTTLALEPQKAILFWCVTGLLLASLLFGSFYLLIAGQYNARIAAQAADTRDAPLQIASAVVESKTSWSGNPRNWSYSGLLLNMHINGRPASTAPQIRDERTFGVRVGDTIQVKYRVGKSNRIYIEEWQPLSNNKL